ncbi:MAG: wax ester/triacylglycerol synthase family O-acyltransferase [Gammaproteobacteria bacterium]|nr:wax ester/triacylglycerol synthase family O-acyltransferase [Gammaproteobacteria bacterium]
MSKLSPVDLSFLLLETPSRQMHMTAYQVFRLPARERNTFIPRLLAAYRSGPVAKPFNQRLKWLDKGVASWETVEPDLRYHVRHIAAPAPGTTQVLSDIVSFLNSPLLDRSMPLWECYIIEGLEDDQFAIMIKVHHAMIDGMGALKLFDQCISRSPADKGMNSIWMPMEKPAKSRPRTGRPQAQNLLSRLGKLPANLLQIGAGVAELGAQNLRLKPAASSLPFAATKTLFNNIATSSERRYGSCEIPLAQVKALAGATGTTVNDIVMTVIDHGLHAYLEEHEAPTGKPLVALMAMSVRAEGQEASGNQTAAELVAMGKPGASVAERLQQIHTSTGQIKENSSKLPVAVRQLYAMLLFGSTTLPDIAAAFRSMPSINLVISNMRGPQGQRYLAGAPMVSFQGCPIVPPGAGLNVSFVSVNETICLGVGAAPGAVADPHRLTRLILAALAELETIALPGKATAKRPAPKKTTTRGATARTATPKKVKRKQAALKKTAQKSRRKAR